MLVTKVFQASPLLCFLLFFLFSHYQVTQAYHQQHVAGTVTIACQPASAAKLQNEMDPKLYSYYNYYYLDQVQRQHAQNGFATPYPISLLIELKIYVIYHILNQAIPSLQACVKPGFSKSSSTIYERTLPMIKTKNRSRGTILWISMSQNRMSLLYILV
ncbi:hypothetical protein BY458DRAFT_545028 [Sporodiniella umbellata]|nr:hypothetical protein BY458DRAFT_545028 [Sporodiniella umbellata]